MSCDFCSKKKEIIKVQIEKFDGFAGQNIEEDHSIFLDRGYLRFADLDDAECMDNGLKIKANFCLNCGDKL